jgi:hypothetical protein
VALSSRLLRKWLTLPQATRYQNTGFCPRKRREMDLQKIIKKNRSGPQTISRFEIQIPETI